MTLNSVSEFKSREESKFLALLTRTQQKAAKITGVARRTFANSNGRHRKVANRRCYNKILNTQRSSSNESGSASSGNEKTERSYEGSVIRPNNSQKSNLGRLSLSSAHTTDGEYIDSSEEHLYNDNIAWASIEESTHGYDWRLPKVSGVICEKCDYIPRAGLYCVTFIYNSSIIFIYDLCSFIICSMSRPWNNGYKIWKNIHSK